jgi:integrase
MEIHQIHPELLQRQVRVYHVRFRIDVPRQEKRSYKSVPLCPVSGPGALNEPQRERRAKEIIRESGADTEEHFNKCEGINLGVMFREQAAWWIRHSQTRKRKPVKMRTIENWEDCLNKWLLPALGSVSLADVNNLVVKELVTKMAEGGLSAGSINTYVNVLKLVVASAVNDEGEEICPRKWNRDFIDLPEIKNQKQPSFTTEEATAVVGRATGQYQILFALLAGTGMRIGEALGLEVGKHISKDCSTIYVEQQVWDHAVEPYTKTPAGFRDIDLCPELVAMLKGFIDGRISGFLFQTKTGKPILQCSILTDQLHPILSNLHIGQCGFHAFRRFRTTWLRRKRVPEDLVRFWIGHANKSITDDYSKLKDDVEFRKHCAREVGLVAA